VRDVAEDQDYARVNGIPVVLVSIQRTADSNSVAVVDGVKKMLDTMDLPTGYRVMVSNDTTGAIRASINNTFRELIMTLIVVGIIVLLFWETKHGVFGYPCHTDRSFRRSHPLPASGLFL